MAPDTPSNNAVASQPENVATQEVEVKGLPEINRSGMSKLRQKLNEKLVAAQVKMLIRTPTFNMRPLKYEELDVTLIYQQKGETKFETVRRKCNVCLDPATHLEFMDAEKDPNYRRYLCEECAKKNVTPAMVFFNAQNSEPKVVTDGAVQDEVSR